MKIFGRKSKWDRLRDVAVTTAASRSARQAGKVTLGLAGGAAAATLASAAVSAVRHGRES
jgi:hypothetical protein